MAELKANRSFRFLKTCAVSSAAERLEGLRTVARIEKSRREKMLAFAEAQSERQTTEFDRFTIPNDWQERKEKLDQQRLDGVPDFDEGNPRGIPGEHDSELVDPVRIIIEDCRAILRQKLRAEDCDEDNYGTAWRNSHYAAHYQSHYPGYT